MKENAYNEAVDEIGVPSSIEGSLQLVKAEWKLNDATNLSELHLTYQLGLVGTNDGVACVFVLSTTQIAALRGGGQKPEWLSSMIADSVVQEILNAFDAVRHLP